MDGEGRLGLEINPLSSTSWEGGSEERREGGVREGEREGGRREGGRREGGGREEGGREEGRGRGDTSTAV